MHACEKNLYLAIQLPATNVSSIVILEGDYSCVAEKIANLSDMSDKEITDAKLISVNPQLIQINTKSVYAFSDRLIEFLLNNVITPIDDIEKNIVRMHKYSQFLHPDKNSESIFTEKDRVLLYKKYSETGNSMNDITGFVDKSVEAFITKGRDV